MHKRPKKRKVCGVKILGGHFPRFTSSSLCETAWWCCEIAPVTPSKKVQSKDMHVRLTGDLKLV